MVEEQGARSCPQCGTPRVGAFRFCRSCAFDFELAPGHAARPPAWPEELQEATAAPIAPPLSGAGSRETAAPPVGAVELDAAPPSDRPAEAWPPEEPRAPERAVAEPVTPAIEPSEPSPAARPP